MQKLTLSLLALFFVLATLPIAVFATTDDEPLSLVPPTTTDVTSAQWKSFNQNLVQAITSDNEGLKLAGLQMVIKYGTAVDVSAARFDIVRMYRDHDNERVRRMAVVALGAMEDAWALDFLTRSLAFERSALVRRTMEAVLWAQHNSTP